MQVGSGAPAKNPVVILVALGFSSLSVSLMQSLVIPIQSELPRLLGTTASNASWVVTATLLGGAVAMPVAGRLADIVGKKPVLAVSALILLAGSLICALSGSLLPVLAGRVLQGLAMGYIPVAISFVREAVPKHLVNTATAAISATLGVGGALGLPLAAWIAQDNDWHWLFWVATALAVAVALLTVLVLPHVHDAHEAKLDVLGAIGLAIGLVGILVGVTKGNDWGWTAGSTLGLIGGGIVVLLAWGLFELRHDAPLVDLRTTARRPVLLTNIAAALIGFGLMAQAIVVPQLLQMPAATGYGLGQSLLAAGLWMAPSGLMMLLFAPVSSFLITRFGGRTALSLGAAVLALGYLSGAVLMDAPWQLLLATCIASAGVGIGYAAMPTLVLENVPPSEAAAGVAFNALMRSIGTTVAGAVMAVVLTSQTTALAPGAPEIPTVDAFRLCFVVGAVAAAIGAAVVLFIPRRKPAEPDVPAATADEVVPAR
ncbi:MFS transporter [Nocardia sp. NPDC057227]|uniref:MFS transporter n=1 Tax=Nocardia sp. NPDC057227 TaxID=3346056 RepID=UPI003632B639